MKHDDIADSCEVAIQGLQAGSDIHIDMFTKTTRKVPFSRRMQVYDNGYGSDDKWLN